VLFGYRIDDVLAVGARWWVGLACRSGARVLLRTGGTFPASHPTTRLCLHLMVQAIGARPRRTLVDVGCGSGVLALAGVKLGVERAVAIDISPRALVVCRSNAELNRVAERLLLVRCSAEALRGPFDLVLANLPLPVLARTMADLARLSGGDAPTILSGFQDVDQAVVEAGMKAQGLVGRAWLRADLTFADLPPSGSFTWMAVLAQRE
jgi:ribosomal protein L11 methyltransferase